MSLYPWVSRNCTRATILLLSTGKFDPGMGCSVVVDDDVDAGGDDAIALTTVAAAAATTEDMAVVAGTAAELKGMAGRRLSPEVRLLLRESIEEEEKEEELAWKSWSMKGSWLMRVSTGVSL